MSGSKRYDVLWSFCKHAPEETIGRVMTVLAGRKEASELSENEQAFVDMILDDERYMMSAPILGDEDVRE